MSEWNTIYDMDNNVIGIFRHGVAWRKEPRERLGVYDDDFVYNNDTEVLAKISGDSVVDIIGDLIGEIKNKDLYINGKHVGKFIGSKSAGAAALVLLFHKHNDVL
jgi:hypothetical protein